MFCKFMERFGWQKNETATDRIFLPEVFKLLRGKKSSAQQKYKAYRSGAGPIGESISGSLLGKLTGVGQAR